MTEDLLTLIGPTVEITRAIILNQLPNLVLPNYTPKNWWECDVAALTAKGYLREFEIKVSHQDFTRDFLKRNGSERKHQLLADGDHRGPTQFWFVMPEELAGRIAVPPYAGLITVVGRYLRKVKSAPRLHNHKRQNIAHAMGNNASHRYIELWLRRGP